MDTLAIDIETFSPVDLKSGGVYKYVEHPDFAILLFACSFNDGPIEIFDLTKYDALEAAASKKIVDALTDPNCKKTAHNAAFERTCIAKFLHLVLPPQQWECTMIKAAMCGLPMSLDAVSKALGLQEKKMTEGKALIKYFCTPCKPTKVNGQRTRNLPTDDIEKWEKFKEYCVGDVVVETAIRKRIQFFEVPDQEKQLWSIDQNINDGGILLDKDFVQNAIRINTDYIENLTVESSGLTGLENSNSPAQLKAWLSEEIGEDVSSLTKEAVPLLMEKTHCDTVKRVLNIRQEMAKTSVKKYAAMMAGICTDNRVRGLLQFYGANRTGRWAGRLVQVQNLPKNELDDLDLARQLVLENDGETLAMAFGNVPDTLSQLIRTAFIAPKGHTFIVADFSAIEARVIAWLAGERWRLQVFDTHGKIYEASAAQMFGVPIETISYKDPITGEVIRGKNYPLRAKGKVSELALGYQGGPNALIKMGALKMGLLEEELPKMVKMWRNANKAIVKLWNTINDAAVRAIENGKYNIHLGIKFTMDSRNDILYIQLPSGRKLCYQSPRLQEGQYGMAITYMGMDQTTKQWKRQDTYGGKLVENIVQAIARDCLAYSMLQLTAAGFKIVMHVHDEVVIEEPDSHVRIGQVNKIMSAVIPWAPGLPLKAESYETKYYKKD